MKLLSGNPDDFDFVFRIPEYIWKRATD